MLPEMDGLEVCRRLRQNPATQTIPIVMLTARGDEVDRVLGLEMGADDYVVKPFSPRGADGARPRGAPAHPAARRAPRRSRSAASASTPRPTSSRWTTRRSRSPAAEFDLLRALVEARGRVLSREYLLDHVWGYAPAEEIESRTVDVHVRRLRAEARAPRGSASAP